MQTKRLRCHFTAPVPSVGCQTIRLKSQLIANWYPFESRMPFAFTSYLYCRSVKNQKNNAASDLNTRTRLCHIRVEEWILARLKREAGAIRHDANGWNGWLERMNEFGYYFRFRNRSVTSPHSIFPFVIFRGIYSNAINSSVLPFSTCLTIDLCATTLIDLVWVVRFFPFWGFPFESHWPRWAHTLRVLVRRTRTQNWFAKRIRTMYEMETHLRLNNTRNVKHMQCSAMSHVPVWFTPIKQTYYSLFFAVVVILSLCVPFCCLPLHRRRSNRNFRENATTSSLDPIMNFTIEFCAPAANCGSERSVCVCTVQCAWTVGRSAGRSQSGVNFCACRTQISFSAPTTISHLFYITFAYVVCVSVSTPANTCMHPTNSVSDSAPLRGCGVERVPVHCTHTHTCRM